MLNQRAAVGRQTGAEGGLILVVGLLVLFGLVMGYSASAPFSLRHYGTSAHLFLKQLTAAAVGLLLLLALSRFDYRRLRDMDTVLLAGSLLLTLVTLVPIPRITDGSWLLLGPFAFQPTEFAKLALVVYLAASIERKGERVRSFSQGILPFVLVLALFSGVVIQQPDLGMILVLGAITVIMLFLGGARFLHLGLLALSSVPIVFVAVKVAPYRLARFLSFLDPYTYSTSSGYQMIQSLTAIGSGGILGRGLGASRAKLFYLPQAHSDFVFSITAEELGLLGSLVVIALFSAFAYWTLQVAERAPDRFGRLLALGIGFSISFQTLLNLAVAVGIVPVTGLTLPFISNGGSSLVASLATTGVLLNIARQGGRS